MSGGSTQLASDLADRTARANALFIGVWLLLFGACALMALGIADSEKRDQDLALERAHASGMEAGYKLCKSEGR